MNTIVYIISTLNIIEEVNSTFCQFYQFTVGTL